MNLMAAARLEASLARGREMRWERGQVCGSRASGTGRDAEDSLDWEGETQGPNQTVLVEWEAGSTHVFLGQDGI